MFFEYLIVFINSSFTFCFLTEWFDNNLKNILRLLFQVKHVQTSRYLTKKGEKCNTIQIWNQGLKYPKAKSATYYLDDIDMEAHNIIVFLSL